MSTKFNLKYRADIDGLRAIAVSVVVIFHLHIGLLTGGFVGVDVFFVISGYLITRLILKELNEKTFSIKNFYLRRFRRLFPALIFTFIVSTLLAACLLTSQDFRAYGQALLSSVFSVSNIYFWKSSGYFATTAFQKPLLHTWSLSVEEQFYVFWPVMLIALHKLKLKKHVPFLLIFIIVTSLISAEYMITKKPETAFYLLPFRACELALGGLIAAFPDRDSSSSKFSGLTMSVIGIIFILVPVFFYSEASRFPGILAMIPCAGTGLLIYAGPHNPISKLLSSKPLVFTGLISYSFYLIHWPLFVFWKFYLFRPFNYYDSIILLVVSYVLAVIMYKYIETPLRRGKFFKFNSRMVAAALVSTMLIFGGFGYLTTKLNGFPQRIPADENVWVVRTGLAKQTQITEKLEDQFPYGYFSIRGSKSNHDTKVMITGDSHAGRLGPLGYYIYQQNPSTQFTMAWRTACFPLLDMQSKPAFSQSNGVNCRRIRNGLLKTITEENYDAVIIAGRWLPYVGGEYQSQDKGKQRYFVKDGQPITDIESAKDHMEALLDETVKTLTNQNVKVILFSQVPPPAANLRGCTKVPTILITKSQQLSRCRGRRLSTLDNLRDLDEMFERIAKKHSQLAILPSEYFCPATEETCIAAAQNQPLYSDDNHVNKYGARYLAEKANKKMSDFINSK